jgi:hypothetical protein
MQSGSHHRLYNPEYGHSIRGHPETHTIETGSFSSVVIRLVLTSTYAKRLNDMAAN